MPSDVSTDRAALDPETSRRRLTIALPVSGVLVGVAALVVGLVFGGTPATAGHDGGRGPAGGSAGTSESAKPRPLPAPTPLRPRLPSTPSIATRTRSTTP
ncbi:hypothetical protein [Agromyces protaetiae]|uniref:hypothetical protein n=1 Tax=Agromyces protaetiae TaxID=2509455 RepID=UPI0013EA54CF|nr:hypothetical protein [Agromyces protaetiae]